jgi:membrane protein DedA with SNARE-associated domain
MVFSFLQQAIEFILSLGPFGIFFGMFLESSFVPIPAEAVLVGFGAIGFSVYEITLYGTLGSTLGAAVGYYIGRYGGRPFLEKFGKYFFITPKKLAFVDKWFSRWGSYAVLVSRLIPIVPYKVFSIGAGIVHIKFKPFILWTLVGTIPRTFILGSFGNLIYTTQNLILLVAALLVLIVAPILFSKWFSKNRK